MKLQQRFLVSAVALILGLSGVFAADSTAALTAPKESLGGMRPGGTLEQFTGKYGKPDVTRNGGLLRLYGGSRDSNAYGWFMVQNPNYTVPDLAVETATDSDRVDLVMAIGYDGFKTEKGVACFQNEEELIKAYGKPSFAFAAPMNGFVLRELYYPELGISFDLAPTGPTSDRQIIAIYVTYPEYLKRAIELRKTFIKDGTGEDITYTYNGGTAT